MILIGQYDSPFVRRVGIALRHYGIAFEQRAWGVFRDAEQIAAWNPLRKVPTLVLDDGTALAESFVCLEWIDGRVAEEQGGDSPLLLLARSGAARSAGLRVCGFAVGVMEKAVSLVYERLLRDEPSPEWSERCERQVRGALSLLEGERVVQRSAYWLGDRISHADVAVTCATTFLEEAHPGFLADGELPALRELARRCEARPEFRDVRQPFVVHR
jgi:glutathione S-transferase